MRSKKKELFHAIGRKDADAVAAALKDGIDPNTAESSGYFVNRTALMHAAACQFPEGVKLLLEAGANVNASTQKGVGAKAGYTALHGVIDGNDPVEPRSDYAVRLQIVKLLLQAGADPNAVYGADTTPIYSAASAGYVEIVGAMIDAGADPRRSPPGCFSPLHGAAQGCHETVARRVLDAGMPVDAETTDGFTPLMTAGYRGCDTLVRLFLERGANPNHRAADGRTPLINAALYAQDTATDAQHERAWRIVKQLLEAGADPTPRNRKGETALEIASRSQNGLAAECIREFQRKSGK